MENQSSGRPGFDFPAQVIIICVNDNLKELVENSPEVEIMGGKGYTE